MARCSYCGKSASWFSNSHQKCATSYYAAITAIKGRVRDAVFSGQTFPAIEDEVKDLARGSFVHDEKLQLALKDGFSAGAEKIATEGGVDPEMYRAINRFGEALGLQPGEIGKTRGFRLALFALVIYGAINGTPIDFGQTHPFNLAPDEDPILFLGATAYFKETVERRRQGSYAGLSVPIGGGMRANLGSFQSVPVEQHYFKEIDFGGILLGTRNFYFRGDHVAFSIPYRKILSLEPYTDALGIFRNGANSKQELFLIRNPDVPNPGAILHGLASFMISQDARQLYS